MEPCQVGNMSGWFEIASLSADLNFQFQVHRQAEPFVARSGMKFYE